MDLGNLLVKLGLSTKLTQDISLLLVIVAISFAFGMLVGRYKLITVLVNIYVSFAIVTAVPQGFFSSYNYKLLLFLGIIVVLTLASRRLFEMYFTGSGSGFLWRVFVMSFLEVIFLISVIFSIIPKKVALGYVSSAAYDYLASGSALLIWMLVPLAFLFFIHRRLNR